MTTFYVSDTNGDDLNPGTLSYPFKTIYKGINMSNNGDTVRVLPGTYYPTFSTRPIVNKSINLIGSGKTDTIIDGINITGWTTDWKQGLVEIRADNVLFSGFTVQNVIEDGTTGKGATGICTAGASNVVIEKNRVYNVWSSGIQLHGTQLITPKNIIVRYNEIDHACCGGDPTKNRQETLSATYVDNIEIYYNYIHISGYTPSENIQVGGEGIDLKDGVNNGKIHHNYLYDVRSLGIYVDGYSRYCNDIEVYDNIVEKTYSVLGSSQRGTGVGIAAERGGSVERINFHDNVIYMNKVGFILYIYHHPDSPYSSTGIRDIVFNNNVIYDDTDKEIFVGRCLETLANIQIINNYANNIYIDPCYQSVTTLLGNIIDPNSIINEFYNRYNILKSDILNRIYESRRNKQMVNILTNIGYISTDRLKTWLGLGKPVTIYSVPQTFVQTITHALTDVNSGKTFVIPNFPESCIIKEIRIRSNFISGQQTWRVAFVDNANGITPTDTSISCRTAEIFAVGDCIYIEDEMTYVSAVNVANNTITVTRGIKGTVASYHNYDARMETANNGLRLTLFSSSSRKLADRLRVVQEMMSWRSTINTAISANDKMMKFASSPLNIEKYDTLYLIDGNNSERVSVEGVNRTVKNAVYNNTVYVADPLLAHPTGIEVQKQMIYDIPILFSGGDKNIYGTLQVDEKIDSALYPSGITVNIEIIVEVFYGK